MFVLINRIVAPTYFQTRGPKSGYCYA